MKSFTNLQDLVPQVAKRYGLSQNLGASHVLLCFDRWITEHYPTQEHCARGGFIKNNILFCYARSGIVAQEVVYKKRSILTHIKNKTGQNLENLIIKVRASECGPKKPF